MELHNCDYLNVFTHFIILFNCIKHELYMYNDIFTIHADIQISTKHFTMSHLLIFHNMINTFNDQGILINFLPILILKI